MKLLGILVVAFSLGLWLAALGEELTVQVPSGEYEFWLEWKEDGVAKEGKHVKASGGELKVDVGEVPGGAKEQRFLVLDAKRGLLAERGIQEGATEILKGADFHFIPELKVTVRVPEEEARLLAEIVLDQPGAHRTAQVEIRGREGSAVFERVEALGTTRVRVKAPGYTEYEVPVTLVDAEKKAVSAIEVGLARAAPPAPPTSGRLPPERSGWFVFFLVGALVAGVASLLLGAMSLLAMDTRPFAAPRQWLASIWGPPLLGVVGWLICALLLALTGGRGEWVFLLPVVGWAYLLTSAAGVGKRLFSGSALLGTGACASAGLAFLAPFQGGLFWPLFVFAALTLVSSLVGGLVVAFGGPVVAVRGARPVEAGICPFCGQRRDPATGACGCEPGRPRLVVGPRLVVEAGERIGEAFSIGDRFAIGREAGNDLVLGDMTVSRRHCVIVRQGEGMVIRDEGSANGTLVNGERVSERSLSAGDRIQVGSMVMRFEG